MNLKILLFSTVLFVSSITSAKERARPNSKGGNYLFEINSSVVFEGSEELFELGFDLERFVEGANHHFALGLASELSFTEGNNDYYLGPLFSFYYHHFKAFFTTGVLTDFDEKVEWKSRLGLGYEFVFAYHFVFIPSVSVDYLEGNLYPVLGAGVACEF